MHPVCRQVYQGAFVDKLNVKTALLVFAVLYSGTILMFASEYFAFVFAI